MKLVARIFAERRTVMVPLVLFLLANIGVLLGVVWPMQRAVNGADEARYQATVSLAETDSTGRYQLENVPPGRYYITAGRLDVLT